MHGLEADDKLALGLGLGDKLALGLGLGLGLGDGLNTGQSSHDKGQFNRMVAVSAATSVVAWFSTAP